MCSHCDANEYREVIAENVRAAQKQEGRYDREGHVASHLHRIKDLRKLQAPRSTGDAGYMATEAEPETLPPTPEKAV